jgi:hypothetical protein
MFRMNNLRAFLIISALGCLPMVHAANMSKEAYKDSKVKIDNTYKIESKACDTASGNAKDICVETAKGKQNIAKTDLEYQYTGKASDKRDAQEARIEAEFEVAKERCDDKAGNENDVCMTQAKSTREKAMASLGMHAETTEIQKDANHEMRKADYKVAYEKCDSFSGDAKNSCIQAAKKQYGMR